MKFENSFWIIFSKTLETHVNNIQLNSSNFYFGKGIIVEAELPPVCTSI